MDWKQLLASITGSVDEELRLRNQIKARRLLLTDAERKTLAEIGHKLGRQALQEIATIAQADTILAWHRKFMDQHDVSSPQRPSVGRPRIAKEREDLVVRMARENRSWGYDRIVGALSNLGYGISDQTVGNILKRQGLLPAPERKKTTTWRECIRLHMDMLVVSLDSVYEIRTTHACLVLPS
jgi:putative transposase